MITTYIDAPSAWTSAGLAGGKADLAFDLDSRHLNAFGQAFEVVRKQGLALEQVTRADVPLAAIQEDLRWLRNELATGRGIVVVRGFPVDDWPPEDIALMFWCIGVHLGTALSQSVLGDRLGHVRDMSASDPDARAYRNHQELRLHTDLCEYIGMLSLSTASSGGESRYASVAAIHNAILEEGPEHLEPLYHGFHLYRLGEQAEGDLPYTPHRVPVLSVCEGHLSARYIRAYAEAAATLMKEPLPDAAIAALDFLDVVAHRDDVMLEAMLEPGEATFINNYLVFHARRAFEDDVDAGRQRHLLRLWLDSENKRPTVPEIELFPSGGIAKQAGRQPSGEGDLLQGLGAKPFSVTGKATPPTS